MTSSTQHVRLIRPSLDALPGYVAALRRGWSPDNVLGKTAADEELNRIDRDPQTFVDLLDDPDARGAPVILKDGAAAPRLPGLVRWVWDGDFSGSISLRWRPGTSSLPAHVLGHVGYAIVPWKRRRGYATQAVALLLPEVKRQGLDHIDLTTDPDNVASQKVILSNGGRLIGRFQKPENVGGGDGLLYRISV